LQLCYWTVLCWMIIIRVQIHGLFTSALPLL
jgi:hypothetical protein